MAVWDIVSNSSSLTSDPQYGKTWAIDEFKGAHAVPLRKDVVLDTAVASGGRVIHGPYEIMPFSLGGWIEGNTYAEAQVALTAIIGRFGGRLPVRFSWKGEDNQGRLADVRVTGSSFDASGSGRGYRWKIHFENLWGAWYSEEITLTGQINGAAVDLNSQYVKQIYPWPSFMGRVEVYGVVTNPTVTTGGEAVTYNGTVPGGGFIRFDASPPAARTNLTTAEGHVLSKCSYLPRWGHLLTFSDTLQVTGGSPSAGSSWKAVFRKVIV